MMTDVVTTNGELSVTLCRSDVPLSLGQRLELLYPPLGVIVIRQIHTQRTLELRSIVPIIFTSNNFVFKLRQTM